ncbi:helix-turn-helix transcriptional regulator [Limibaculum sp. FT325]|uniref:winged helix-turn-helix transcriptional regulator n=1 Tax=Thermohalobaculum sediminis TaxID=2939436 RepID=UPI0020C0BACA|nr:helix-turn-helix domain-containing protein [Limibaculum sediminis]MCL5776122.1 helix-turn-helix transcriptional regulator [Limibaculum sediminis]
MPLKVRKNQSPPPPEQCPLLECMAIIGGAWTPNILWYLRGGPRRFSELRTDIPRISPKVLTTRLRELEDCGVVERRVMPTSPPSVEYSLNDLGRRLVPAIEAIAAVGEELKARQGAVPEGGGRPKHFRAPVSTSAAKDAAPGPQTARDEAGQRG